MMMTIGNDEEGRMNERNRYGREYQKGRDEIIIVNNKWAKREIERIKDVSVRW